MCKSSTDALNERRISIKSSCTICMSAGLISNSCSRISVKKRRMVFSFGFKNCFTATNISFISDCVSVSTLMGIWQLLCKTHGKQRIRDEMAKMRRAFPTHRKHAFPFAKYQYWNIHVVIDCVKFEIDIQLLLLNEIGNVSHTVDTVVFQFARLELRFVKHKMRVCC